MGHTKARTKVWAVFHDRIGYQVYQQAETNPIFYYCPQDIRWRQPNIGECLGEYDNENAALAAKTIAEDIEKLERQEMLDAMKLYYELKFKLEDKIRNAVNQLGGKIEI